MINKTSPPLALRWIVLIFGSLGYLDLQMTYLSCAPVLPLISRSLNIDPGAATIVLMSSFLAAGSFTWILVGGYVCDRFGIFVTLMAGFFCLAVPATLTPWIGNSATAVLWLRIAEGLATGFMFPTIPAIANTLFPQNKRGLASGLMNSFVSLGNSAGVLLGPIVLATVGGDWKQMSASLSVLSWSCLFFGVVLYALYNEKLPHREDPQADANEKSLFRQALFSPLTLLGVATSFMAVWSLQGIFTLTSSFLAADKPLGAGYGALTAGKLTLGATLLAGVFGPIINGLLLDRVFHGRAKWNLYIGFVLMCVCVYLLKFSFVTGSIGVLELDLILAGLGPMFTFPTMYYLVACFYPGQIVGKMGGLWCGVGNLGGVIGMYLAGMLISSEHSYNLTFTVQAVIAAVGIAMTAILVNFRKRVFSPRPDMSPNVIGVTAD